MAENVEKKKIGAKVKGLFGELRKVTWPTLGKVVSQTGVVLAVTLFFLLVLMGMDAALQQLYKLLVSGQGESTAAVTLVVTQPAATVFQTFGALTPLGL